MLSDDDDGKWTSSNESVSSVVGSSSSPFKPHSFKSITKSSFKVSSQPLSGCPSNDLPCCEPSSYLPPIKQEGMAHKELEAHPNALPNNLWQCLWRHSDCYDLRKVWMMLKGRVLIVMPQTVSSCTSSSLVPFCCASSPLSCQVLIHHPILTHSTLQRQILLFLCLQSSSRMHLPPRWVHWVVIGSVLVACTCSVGPNWGPNPSNIPLLQHHFLGSNWNIFPFQIGWAA